MSEVLRVVASLLDFAACLAILYCSRKLIIKVYHTDPVPHIYKFDYG
jgi:hypothetical protein